MPRRCSIPDYVPPSPTVASPGVSNDDGLDQGPLPNLRGNYRGFLTAEQVNQLNASADSGNGLALFGSGGAAARHPVIAILLVAAAVHYFSRKSR